MSIDQISQMLYPENEQQQAEFVQHYRATTSLKRSLLKELLPNLSDSQIAEVLHEYTVRNTHRQIARNHRLRFVREFLYRTGLDSLIRHVKSFTKKHSIRIQHAQFSGSSPLQLDPRTVTKLRKTVTQISREYKRDYQQAIKSKESNRSISLSQQA